jgi:ribonucleotide reductase beta subunit family protein with ferritin-like domain
MQYNSDMLPEPLLSENPNKYTIFPVDYQDIWDMYKKHLALFWTVNDIKISKDRSEFNNLSDNEKHFIKNVLAFFAASDGIVLENLGARFISEIQSSEARCFYAFQMAMENIHGETYALLLDTYIDDSAEKQRLFKAIETIPSVREKALWAQKWIESSDSFAARLVAFACVEGIFFSGSFCCIFWFKQRGILSGLCESNEFISRDEGLHQEFAELLYSKYIVNKLSDETVHAIVSEAVQIEESFIIDSLPCRLLGMNSDMMREYIRFVANRLVKRLGHTEIYPEAKQPFSFMDRICVSVKNNFFEQETTQYQTSVEPEDAEMTFDAYF